jgi:hypothetical protein
VAHTVVVELGVLRPFVDRDAHTELAEASVGAEASQERARAAWSRLYDVREMLVGREEHGPFDELLVALFLDQARKTIEQPIPFVLTRKL